MSARPLQRLRHAALTAALTLVVAALGGCGQKGPLTLPDKARPIERLPTTPAPGAEQNDKAPSPEENQEERSENER